MQTKLNYLHKWHDFRPAQDFMFDVKSFPLPLNPIPPDRYIPTLDNFSIIILESLF